MKRLVQTEAKTAARENIIAVTTRNLCDYYKKSQWQDDNHGTKDDRTITLEVFTNSNDAKSSADTLKIIGSGESHLVLII